MPGSKPRAHRDHPPALLGLLPVLLSALVQSAILECGFHSDDFLHLYTIRNHGFAEFFFKPHGGHLLLTYNAVFFLFHELFGLRAELYFAAVLLTHLAGAYLLYQVLARATGQPWLAAFCAALWGMSPVDQGALEWLSVFGHVLAGVGVLWILYDLARVGRGELEPSLLVVGRWYGLWLAVSTSFGVGLGMAACAWLVTFLLLPRRVARGRIALGLASLAVVIPAIYVAVHHLYTAVSGHPAPIARIDEALAGHWRGTLAAWSHLVSYGIASLSLGPLVAVSPVDIAGGVRIGPLRGLASMRVMEIAWLLALVFGGACAQRAWRGSPAERRWLLAALLLAGSCYGAIAAGRAPLLAPLGPDRIAVTTRYHYAATIFLALALGVVVAPLARARVLARLPGATPLLAWVALTGLLYFQSSRSISARTTDDSRQFEAVRTAIARAIADRPAGSDVYIENGGFRVQGMRYPKRPRFPGWAAVFVIAYPENEVEGRRVYFVERDAALRRQATKRPGTRISSLLVASRPGDPGLPEDVPPGTSHRAGAQR